MFSQNEESGIKLLARSQQAISGIRMNVVSGWQTNTVDSVSNDDWYNGKSDVTMETASVWFRTANNIPGISTYNNKSPFTLFVRHRIQAKDGVDNLVNFQNTYYIVEQRTLCSINFIYSTQTVFTKPFLQSNLFVVFFNWSNDTQNSETALSIYLVVRISPRVVPQCRNVGPESPRKIWLLNTYKMTLQLSKLLIFFKQSCTHTL